MRMTHASAAAQPVQRGPEAGFTLIEALIAMVILSFGLVAIFNLVIVAATSNGTGSLSTAAAAVATERLERIKAAHFDTLAPGGSVAADAGAGGNCRVLLGGGAGNYNCDEDVPGVGRVHVRWQMTVARPNVLFIRVQAESPTPMQRGRTRAIFTTFRARSL